MRFRICFLFVLLSRWKFGEIADRHALPRCQFSRNVLDVWNFKILGNGNAQELDAVQQAIVDIQEAVLALHKSQQQGTISDTDYDIKLVSYGQQMDALQLRLKELKESANRYAEVKYWLDTYKAHIQSGESMNTDDAVMLRSLVEKIIVYDKYMEIYLRCGALIEKPYV